MSNVEAKQLTIQGCPDVSHISPPPARTPHYDVLSSRPRVDSVLPHDELNLALHLAVVDATTLLETDAVPFLVRLLVVPVAARSIHHLLVTQYPVGAMESTCWTVG